ncbi:MAG: EAL domain-containing protein [Rhizobiaceae bacterium]
MNTVVEFAGILGENTDWLVSANVIFSVLLCLWILRYRALYLKWRQQAADSKALIDNLAEGVYRSNIEGQLLCANAAQVRLNGYSTEAELIASVKDVASEWYVEPNRRAEFQAILARDGHVRDFISEIYRHKTRERIWISECAHLMRDQATGLAVGYEGSVREITHTVQKAQLEDRLRKLADQVPGGLFQLVLRPDNSFHAPYVSSGFMRLYGLAEGESIADAAPLLECIHPDDREAHVARVLESAETLNPFSHEYRLVINGCEKWVTSHATPERVGEDIVWSGYVGDTSARKSYEISIETLAYFDTLTGLPNRRMLLDRLSQAAAGCARRKDLGALLFVDLDNFKALNDTFGHDAGDDYLAEVAKRLRSVVRKNDTVARIGGDEFVIIIEDIGADRENGPKRAEITAQKALDALRAPVHLGSVRYNGFASIGIVIFDGTETRVDELLKRADLAMYEAKAAGRNGIITFNPEALSREADRSKLLQDLREAILAGDLDLHFQPQVNRHGAICGAEALVRWAHPVHGLLTPERFVPMAEQSGLGEALSAAVLANGIKTLARWQADPATSHLKLSLNVNATAFANGQFGALLKRQVAESVVDASALTLEFSEKLQTRDKEQLAARMNDIKALGVRFSLDDFGAGYSSIANMKALPWDEVKIDGAFVADIENSEHGGALVRTILAMAKSLGLAAVAEHVESEKQESLLRAYGCDLFQGYLYAGALNAEAFAHHVRADKSAVTSLKRA